MSCSRFSCVTSRFDKQSYHGYDPRISRSIDNATLLYNIYIVIKKCGECRSERYTLLRWAVESFSSSLREISLLFRSSPFLRPFRVFAECEGETVLWIFLRNYFILFLEFLPRSSSYHLFRGFFRGDFVCCEMLATKLLYNILGWNEMRAHRQSKFTHSDF